jgi:threonine dehydratase
MFQVVVKEEWIAIAILRLVELEKCVVEGAGAAGLAVILAGHLSELKGKKLVTVNYLIFKNGEVLVSAPLQAIIFFFLFA